MFSKKKTCNVFHKRVREVQKKKTKKANNNFNSISYMLSTHVVKCGMSSRGFSSKLRNTDEKLSILVKL